MTEAALARQAVFLAALAILSAAVVRLAIVARIMDRPAARKAHAVATPKGGGLGIVAAFLTGLAVLDGGASVARLAEPQFHGVIAAAIGIAAVAFVDDIRDFPFAVKLGAQILAALLAVVTGVWVRAVALPGWGVVGLGWAGAVGTVAWVLLATNATNFIDGLNGLAAGVTLIACLFLAPLAAAHGAPFVYAASLALAGGVLGFLPFNFPRARIFMGDVGSQFCGFVLAILGIAAARFPGVALSFLVVPLLLSGVLFDVAFTLVRRTVAGLPIALAHRGHLYQLAHRAGIPATVITLTHWAFAAWGGAVCLAFPHVDGLAKFGVLALVLPPQLAWLGLVTRRARRAGLTG